MTYSDLLRDPRWQRKRLEILEERGWACEECGDGEMELHVHHLRYERGHMPWEYPHCDLQVLCKKCHDEVTEWSRRFDDLVQHVKVGGLLDIQEAVGFLSALVANSADWVASHRTCVEVHGATDEDGVGAYVFRPRDAGERIRAMLKDGYVNAYEARLNVLGIDPRGVG